MKRVALESHDPSDRKDELESKRVTRAVDAADAWAALLDLSVSLSPEEGSESIACRVLDTLSVLLPRHATGICLVPSDGGRPWVDVRLPAGMLLPESNPTRLFPDLPDERILTVEGLPGTTLHVATARGRIADGSSEHEIAGRAAAVLGRALRSARLVEEARPVSVELGELRSQLVQAEKLATLGQIVAGVVHELANPLTSIVACTDFLLRRKSAPPEETAQLKRIELAADRVLKFARDLVAYARPARETPGPLPIHEVIEQARAFSEHEFERRNIAFGTDYSEGAPPILGQAGPLTQVFVNLFTNAAHAMNDHGGNLQVRTRVSVEEGRLYVDVTDTGIGIPPQTIGKVFEPFFTTKEKGQGTGLGLSIVREIALSHGGGVDVASTPGEGSRFTVALPLYERPRTAT